MNSNLWKLAATQGLFLTNNVVFIAINGLVGLRLAPANWMATLPVMGYVVGGALATGLVAASQRRWGRKVSFQLGLLVALMSVLVCALALVVGVLVWTVSGPGRHEIDSDIIRSGVILRCISYVCTHVCCV